MKIDGMPGEYAFKALVQRFYKRGEETPAAYVLSDYYFLTDDDAKKYAAGMGYKWPVEVDEHGVVYIPDPSEYEVKSEDK